MSDPNRRAEKAARLAAQREKYDRETAGLEFREWPKIARLNRDVVITEKIDGTNSAIGITVVPPTHEGGTGYYRVYAQSRTRIITPDDDNFGFAAWVRQHEDVLVRALGPGLHYGEWWGVGIQRGYGLSERRFSLFNTEKWDAAMVAVEDENGARSERVLEWARKQGVALYTVPVLWKGPWCVAGVAGFVDNDAPVKEDGSPNWSEESGNPRPRFMPNFQIEHLRRRGSVAVPGFMKPEGIVVFHRASGTCFKATLEKDEAHKFEQTDSTT